MSKPKLLTLHQFNERATPLRKRLTEELEKERTECALPELGKDPNTDLWLPPNVDSKTVVKLSPTVKEFTGWRLDPRWIKKGGYSTIEAAVIDVMAQIKAHCVSDTAVLKTKQVATA